MADIEKDPKNFETSECDEASVLSEEAADLSPEENLARTALKDLVRSAGDALGGLLDEPQDEPQDEPRENSVEMGTGAELNVQTDMAQVEWKLEGVEFVDSDSAVDSVVDLEMGSVEEIEAHAQERAESDADSADGDLSEEESRLADEELGPAEFIEADRMQSIIEALLFASDRPVSLATIKTIFKGSNIRTRDITRCLDQLASEYAGGKRGVSLEEINGGYQLRTKVDNAEYLKRLSKTRPFRLSGPALETMAIVAYKQPLTKHEVDEIRGVESGHLIRALMERGLVCFQGKSEGPGKPMLYGTTRKFLETFGLRNIKELPTLAEIDELLPDGIGEEAEAEKPKLADLTDQMSEAIRGSYSEGEEELQKITDSLTQIDTSSEFFEQEKVRQREKRDAERAANIREALAVGEAVEDKDVKWLKRYDAKLEALANPAQEAAGGSSEQMSEGGAENVSESGVAALADEEAENGAQFRKDIETLSQDFGATDSEESEEDDSDLIGDSDWADSGEGDAINDEDEFGS